MHSNTLLEKAMHPIIQILKNSLSMAAFPNEDIRDDTINFVDSLGKDLAESGYVEDTNTNKFAKELNETVSDYVAPVADEEVKEILSNVVVGEDEGIEESDINDIDKTETAEITWDKDD